MKRRPGPLSFLSWLTKAIEDGTGTACLTDPQDTPSPFYCVQLTATEAQDTKTERIERFDVWIHCLSGQASAGAFEMVEILDGVLEELSHPALIDIERQGIQNESIDQVTGEGHAVVAYAFDMSCGPICK